MKEILKYMEKGQTHSIRELAELLDVSENTIVAQIEYLEKLGVLRRIEMKSRCSKGCKNCGTLCESKPHASVVMWEKVNHAPDVLV